MSSSPHGRSLAVVCVSAIALAVGAMYIAQKDSKATEGRKSIYNDNSSGPPAINRPKVDSDGKPQSDSRMNSADVREALHKVPGKDR